MKYYPEEFIHICNKTDQERQEALKNGLGFEKANIQRHWNDIEKVLNFVREIDESNYKFDKGRIKFFSVVFHDYISSDLRSLLILFLTGQNYQLNIVLRHFIETFIYSLWADIVSNFKGTLDYYLFSRQWKPFRTKQEISWEINKNLPNRSIKERLERVRIINSSRLSAKKFYKLYFSTASSRDIELLFSLPICKRCYDTEANRDIISASYRTDPILRRRGKEDKSAVYRTDFGYVCSFCNKQRFTTRYAKGVLDMNDMIKMLRFIIDDKYAENIQVLENLYGYLSKEFVHFSTTVIPTGRPRNFNTGKGSLRLWRLKGVIFCLDIIKPLMQYYFNRLSLIYKKRKTKKASV
jgi:hypothetical protein